ncbi:MAG: lyase family protein [Amphiplicatus sp.]
MAPSLASVIAAVTIAAIMAAPANAETVQEIFSPENEAALVMEAEAALARAQASFGVIPKKAAAEISEKADLSYAPFEEIVAARAIFNHRMVALLHVWRKRLSADARESLHYGTTTVDIYDTVLSLQLSASLDALLRDLDAVEARMAALAEVHRDTPMVGRTLGQHALVMTFGKKVAVWIGEIDRHRERLCEAQARIDRSVILKGPVGSYAGLGPRAAEIEKRFAKELNRRAPYADDWHGARDVYAEIALDIALMSRGFARVGQEVFLLQSSDIGEVAETRDTGAASSSSMPQKVNPALSEALIYYGRTIPRDAEIILDDVVNFFERDNTSRPNENLGALMIEAQEMLRTADDLVARLNVDSAAMRRNIDRSGPFLRAQAAVQLLTPSLGRETAEREVKLAAEQARLRGETFLGALQSRPLIAQNIAKPLLEKTLDPLADLDGAGREVDAVLDASLQARRHGCIKS